MNVSFWVLLALRLILFLGILGVLLLFPLYAAVQAGRKNHRYIARAIYFLYIPPFFMLLSPVALLLALFAFFKYELNKPNLGAEPKLYSLFGIGTSFCGATNRKSDGSFITTQWIRFFGLPLVPIQSYRVIHTGETSSFNGAVLREITGYTLIEKLPLNKGHVFRNYIFIFVFISILVVSGVIVGSISSDSKIFGDMMTKVALALLGIFVVSGFFLWRAK